MRDEVLGRDGFARHDDGTDPFAPSFVRQPDHRDVGHRRMRMEDVFDFS